ncbi:hypothetical protein PI125_g6265 [Phytophthora idaei]|nr:hypothetical protein PI125_g6265 [Phytophthora idaei]KAG3162084.1 hypothetical protein PI126_g6134 [Phytophthora idaei]
MSFVTAVTLNYHNRARRAPLLRNNSPRPFPASSNRVADQATRSSPPCPSNLPLRRSTTSRGYLDELLDREADATDQADARATEAAFWARVRPHIVVNSLARGANELDRVVQGVIDGDSTVPLAAPCTCFLLRSRPRASAAGALTSKSSKSKLEKGKKPLKHDAPATWNASTVDITGSG